MDPISNQIFSLDSQRFIYQQVPQVKTVQVEVSRPFSLDPPEKTKKTKKDVEKEKEEKERKRKKPFQ